MVITINGQDIEARVIQKIATEAEWAESTILPRKGEFMIVGDSNSTPINIKVGNGVDMYPALPYMFDSIQQNVNYYPVNTLALPTPVGGNVFSLVVEGEYTFGGSPVFTVPVGSLGVIYWDGSIWALQQTIEVPVPTIEVTDKLEKGNTDAIQSGAVFDAFESVANADISLPMPYDKTGETFDTGNLTVGAMYWDENVLMSEGDTLKSLSVIGKLAGSVRICVLTVSGGVSSVFSTVDKTFSVGVNELTNFNLTYPESDYYIGISPLTSDSIGYRSDSTANGRTSVLAGGSVTNVTASFPYWVEKKYVIEDFPETKELGDKVANMIGETTSLVVPENRSSLTLNANSAATLWFGSDGAWFGNTRPFQSVTVKVRSAANDIKVAFFEIVGTTATKLYESPLIDVTAVGDRTITLGELVGVPANINTDYARVQVFVGNEVYTSPSAFGYASLPAGTGDRYYNVNKTTGVLSIVPSTSSTVKLGYWINVGATIYPPIVQAVKDLQMINSSVSNYNQFMDALANSNEIRIADGTHEMAFQINVPAGKRIFGSRSSVLKLSGSSETVLYLNESYGTILEGFTIDGGAPQIDVIGTTVLPTALDLETLTGNGTKKGLFVFRGDGVKVRDVLIRNFDSYGFEMQSTGDNGSSDTSGYRFREGLVMEGVTGENNYISFRMGNGAQYSRFTDIKSIQSICGISVCGGNITVANGQFDNNRVNAHVGAGSNDAHGSFVGGTMNHAKLTGLIVANITNGHVFSGVNFFDGQIEIHNAIGTIITGSLIASEITATLNAGQGANISMNTFRSDGGYNSGTINKTGAGVLTMLGNTFTTGKDASSLNGVF